MVVASLVLLLLLVLVFTPRGISYGLREVLLGNGLDEVTIEDVDFNPFTGVVSIETLQARKAGNIVLSLGGFSAKVDWWPLQRHQLELSKIAIDELLLDMEQKKDGSLVIAGIALPVASAAEQDSRADDDTAAAWGVALRLLSIADSHLFITLPEQKYYLDIDQARLEQLITWAPQGTALLKLDGAVNEGAVHVDMQLRPFAEEMSFSGTLGLERIELADYAHFAAHALQRLGGKLSLHNRFDVRFDAAQGLRLEQKGDLRVEGLQLQQQEITLQHKNLQWDGMLHLQHGLQAGLPSINVQGRLRHDGVSLDLGQQAPALRYGALEWNGQLGLAENPAESLKMNGDIEVQQLHVHQGLVDLLRLPQAHIRALASEGLNMIRADTVTLGGVELLALAGEGSGDSGRPVFTSTSLELKDLQFGDMKNLSVAKVRMQDAQASISRNEDGTIAVISQLSSTRGQQVKSEAVTQADTPQEPLIIRVGEVTMAGNSNAQFSDKSVQPAFNTMLTIDTFRLSELNSAQPENPSPYHLAGKLGKYATLDLKGDVRPFLAQPGVTAKGFIKGLELPALSSYTARALGYDLSSGQLNADLTLSIVDGRIMAENALTLNNLNVKVSDPEKLKGLTTQLSMPLDAALSLLRDKDNNIRLQLPVGGDLQNPKFNLSDIINTALGKVMKKGAMAYLTQALQPYGALLTLAKMAGKAINAIALEPVLFEPVAAVLPAGTSAYMEKIAALMNERPGINIRLCGMATEKDRAALVAIEQQKLQKKSTASMGREEGEARRSSAKPVEIVIPEETLLLLARQRAESLKDHLVNKLKVPAERLFICNPEVDADKEGAPRVELMI